MKISLQLVSILLLVVGGCDNNQLASLDSRNFAPTVSQFLVMPDSIYIDSLPLVNGMFTVSATVHVTAADSDGQSDLAQVTADVVRGNGTLAVKGVSLHDDGLSPDSVRGDGKFAAVIEFSLTRAQAGRYQVRAAATDRQGTISNVLASQLKLARRNSAPSVFNLNAPDSITRPSSGSTLFSMTIAASDSDGLADIAEVYFRSLISSDPTAKYFLYDDGGTIQRNGTTSGDRLAGDGTFSIIVQLPSTTTAGTRLFAFQARDSYGDTSATVAHSLEVR